ncbi:FHA domain-containing protein [Marinimicrobium sp. ABcell2]|uniref:FHA domain-containing protein n=1 Tax=Marinimicrobium sp. ABcell2 TaxID=3069751 RepID=UPI0027AE084C|nr:FHA domain-containing protein [Marinimicrobium sp. ABcell2]MDQ2075569.1 FHA domain-containing protein [Marinimicrobium sp. ABcell2]
MLKLRDPKNRYGAIWLVEPGVKVGRKAGNHLVINSPVVADCQFEIRVKGDQLILKNCAPDHPLNVNGQPVADGYVLREKDLIAFGEIELQLVDPKKSAPSLSTKKTTWTLKANSVALGGRVYPVRNPTLVGRSSECDITLAVAHLSRRHARLEIQDGLLYVKDLGSANGTYLNGVRVSEARVRRGDELSFDTLSFGVIGPVEDLGRTSVRAMPSKISVPPRLQSRPQPAPSVERLSTAHAPIHRSRPVTHLPPRSSVEVSGPGRASSGSGRLWLTLLVLIALSSVLSYRYWL